MGGFYVYTGETGTIISLLNAVVSINVLASVVTILMIMYGLRKRNGYTNLILYMTVAQVIYDTQLFLFNFAVDDKGHFIHSVEITEISLGITFGVVTALYSLAICLIMAAIVKMRTYYNLEKNLRLINFLIMVIGLAEAIPAAISKQLDKPNTFIIMLEIYDGTRLAVITLITIVLVYTYFDLRNRGEYSTSTKKNPILVMVSRLSLYPVVQIVSRIPVEVYQLKYKKPFLSFVHDPVPSPDKLALIYLSTLTVACGGGGNMIVFFIVQPEARGYMKAKLRSVFLSLGLTSIASKLMDRQDRDIYKDRNDGKRVSNIPKSKNPEMNAKLQSFYKNNNSLTRESGFEDSFSDLDIDGNTRPDLTFPEDFDNIEESVEGEETPQRISEMLEKEDLEGESPADSDPIPGAGVHSVKKAEQDDYDDMDEEELVKYIASMEEERRSMNVAQRTSISSVGLELRPTATTGAQETHSEATSINPMIV